MNEIIRLRISAQNSLIGRITNDVRGVYVRINKNNIELCVITDGKSDYWNEVIYDISTDIIADFDDGYNINEELIRLDYPAILSFTDWICVYKRYESPYTK